MKFFILGDSWGVGQYLRVDEGTLEPVPNTGLDHWLTQMGHTATNISAGSASNFGQLRHAYWSLKEHHDYDYIVWFYTEPFRDIIETVIDDAAEAQQQYPDFTPSDFPHGAYITQQNLQYAQRIYDEFAIPFVVIGGQCKVPDEIDSYSFCCFKIKNWAAELLELDFEFPNYTWFNWKKFEYIIDSFKLSKRKFVLDEADNLDKVNVILKKSKASNRFPDNGHPGAEQFQQLAHDIVERLNAR